jgi:homoserine O-acetyltransferase/O-succinyltransferase
MRPLRGLGYIFLMALVLSATSAPGQDLIVEKKTFEMPSYTTVGGQPIKNVKVGWQAAGTLNADRSNVILITHFFSGTSHAFGKYAATDKAAGYWDAIIGPGKAIDTNKYYVISSDTLINLNVKAPNVVTTGPASINPDTGKPYGMSFPIVTFRDMVNVQKALLESLGITRLRAVVGASMGALQAYEWATSYPQMVERLVAVIGHSEPDSFLQGWLALWAQPVTLDPKWKGGAYDPNDPPTEGLKAALKLVTLQATHWEGINKAQAVAPAKEGQDPAKSFDAQFKVEAWLDTAATARAAVSDANHFLYLIKANQLASADPSKIKAPTLLLYAPTDLVFPAALVEQTAKKIAGNGVPVETAHLNGPMGHLNGVLAIAQAGDKIRAFVDK